MPTLFILDDDEAETQLLAVRIKDIDPAVATVAILKALDAIKPPKKTRSDAGIERGPRKSPPAANLQPASA